MRRATLLALPFLLASAAVSPLGQGTPAGTWHTISDVDGKPRGIIVLAVTDGVLTGTIGGSLVPGETPDKRCTACSGDLKDRPLKGMRILDGLRWDGASWTGGTVLDPDTGKTYRATIRVAEDGRSLTLRGYIGISLFGRTQRWVRAPNGP